MSADLPAPLNGMIDPVWAGPGGGGLPSQLTGLGPEQARHRPAALARAVDDGATVGAHVDVARVARVDPEIVGLGKRPLLAPASSERKRRLMVSQSRHSLRNIMIHYGKNRVIQLSQLYSIIIVKSTRLTATGSIWGKF